MPREGRGEQGKRITRQREEGSAGTGKGSARLRQVQGSVDGGVLSGLLGSTGVVARFFPSKEGNK